MATNMYIKFENPSIEGESTAEGHEQELEILSWSHGFAQATPSTRGSGSLEQATHSNFTFTTYLSGATSALLKYCWSGKQIGKATLTCLRSDGAAGGKPVEYLKVVMTDVVISNYSVSGGPGDIPVENVSLDYGVILYQYAALKSEGGALKAGGPDVVELRKGT